MKNFEGILLDLDNTLYPYETTHEAGMKALYETLKSECEIPKARAESAYKKAREHVYGQLNGTASSHNRLLYFQKMCELLKLNPGKYVMNFDQVYWDAYLMNLNLYPDAKTFLEHCRQHQKKICLVTDLIAHVQYRKILHLGLENYIECIVTSEEVGHEKPHPSMFMTALEKLKLQKNEVVMIGDHFEKDVLGARRIGIEAYYFTPNADQIGTEKTVNFKHLMNMF